MPDFVNIGSAPVDVYAPEGHPDTLHVDPGQTITVPGELAAEQAVDAYLVGEGDNARAWPHSQWRLAEPPKPAKKSDATAPSKES